MIIKEKRLQQLPLVFAIALATVGAAATTVQAHYPLALPGCLDTCGNLPIIYPFGIGLNCSLEPRFDLTCENSTLVLGDNKATRECDKKFKTKVLKK
ncbi:hypothetical protein L6164_023490 [Bauhinia variegata]|uniref:Uncharacterized protein n=1 Tax=Bauhinia variegata TaxID=167791 RepID=A0ACB9MIQ3_BAUVA|nr:hypothetical protein L6164_023490 [Bauhinia variegata]